jgi:hypothetical protein
MKAKIILIMMLASVFLTSCTDDNNTSLYTEWCGTEANLPSYRWDAFIYPKNSKLKRIYQVDSLFVFVQTLSEYKYDKSGKIEKVISPASGGFYDDYKYDTEGQLSSILRYKNEDLIQITSFTYDESGKKIKEEIENKSEGTVSYGLSYTLFIYDKDRLEKMESYHENTLKYYELYEYNNSNELIKEKLFVPGGDAYVTTEHTYAEGLLIYSVTYNGTVKDGFMHDTKRYYDRNDNLTLTITNMPGLSSMIPADGKQTEFLERRIFEY